jgi:hypothetical protein
VGVGVELLDGGGGGGGGGFELLDDGGGGGGGGGGGRVTVVGPCGPLVTITRRFVVVGMPGCVVVVVAAVVGGVVGSRLTEDGESVAVRPSPLMTGPGLLAGGLAVPDVAATVATVASTVASATPDPARMTIARDLARLPAGGAICPRSDESVTLSPWLPCWDGVQSASSDVDHRPKSWVQSQRWVFSPMPMATKVQFRMFARCPGEFIQSVITCCALVWPCAMFSPPGLG